MKKITALILTLAMILTFSACGNQDQAEQETSEGGIRIVTTVFPEYDWARVILGDNPSGAELILLTDNGVDLHSYQPNAEDILKITTSDVLIYVGGESDAYIEDALKTKQNENMKEVCLLDVMGDSAKEEEIVEGMEAEEEEHEEEEGPEYDEYVWLSLRNASVLCDAVCDAICQADPENEGYYRENLEAYKNELADLDTEYSQVTEDAGTKTLLFGDRFPFRYMTDDYDLEYFAAFVGCSAETEASFETVTFLSKKVDELGLKHVMTIENSDGKIAQTIIENTESKDQEILSMNSMQSVLREDIENGTTYLDIMKNNLEVLRTALGA